MTKTKIRKILEQRGMSQGDLRRLIFEKSGFVIGRDRISKIYNGILINPSLETMVKISEALDVLIEDISEIENIQK